MLSDDLQRQSLVAELREAFSIAIQPILAEEFRSELDRQTIGELLSWKCATTALDVFERPRRQGASIIPCTCKRLFGRHWGNCLQKGR